MGMGPQSAKLGPDAVYQAGGMIIGSIPDLALSRASVIFSQGGELESLATHHTFFMWLFLF
jgi:hypothetical protein